jgi:GNAT superfamily N-acetyltransferase
VDRLDRERDLAAVAELFGRVMPAPVTAAELRERWRGERPLDHRFVLRPPSADPGRVLGYGVVLRHAEMPEDQAVVWVAIDPDRQRDGLGRRLWSELLPVARSAGAERLLSRVRDDDEESLAWAVRRGFTVARHNVQLELAVDDFPDARTEALLRAAADAEIRCVTLAELGDDLATRKEIHHLETVLARDIPGSPQIPPFEVYQARYLSSQRYRADGVLLAVHGDRIIGLTRLSLCPSGERMMHEITGVLPEYRGRGLARTLKALAVRCARNHGASILETTNDSENVPILSLNEGFGFRRAPGSYVLRREPRSDGAQ